MRRFTVLAALTKRGGIGRAGQMAWTLPSDRAWFRGTTTTVSSPGQMNMVIMGRTTMSHDLQNRSLRNRYNVVLTKNSSLWNGRMKKMYSPSLDGALNRASALHCDRTFVIGGSQVYKTALQHPSCERVVLTRLLLDDDVDTRLQCDRYFPSELLLTSRFRLTDKTDVKHEPCTLLFPDQPHGVSVKVPVQRETYEASVSPSTHTTNVEEAAYLDLMREVLETGRKQTHARTGQGTRSVFGRMLRFSLSGNRFPLMTTRRVFARGAFAELQWMLRGSTDTKELESEGVNIWKPWSSRAYLDKLGFTHREEGDIGPGYGFQWRHFGAPYTNSGANANGLEMDRGFDQIAHIVHLLRTDPTNRRMFLSSWNPPQLAQMSLPPCHVSCQFHVDPQTRALSALLTQRSADLPIGVPYNIASYAMLTCLLAHHCGLERGELVHSIGDAHIYENQVKGVQEQLTRMPRAFPTLNIHQSPSIHRPYTDVSSSSSSPTQPSSMHGTYTDVSAYNWNDLSIKNYYPHPPIHMPVAV